MSYLYGRIFLLIINNLKLGIDLKCLDIKLSPNIDMKS